MIKKLLCILLALFYTLNLNLPNIYASQTTTGITTLSPTIAAAEIIGPSAILMDLNTGTILYGKNEHQIYYPASITKILTTLIALEYNKPNDIITFSDNAIFGIDRGSSNLAMDVAEQITMKDALYGIMLMSANEVAMGVAEHIAGSIDNFSKMMNDRAVEAGALNSNFKNPHGLHDEQHYTTAYDMAMIAKQAYSIKEFRDIIATMTYQIEPTNKQAEIRYLANQHYMYKNTSYHYDGCTGGKTGFTDEAQSTLVTFAQRDGLQLVAVVMHENGNDKYTDTIRLLDYGFNNYKLHTIYANQYPQTLPVYKDSSDKSHAIGNTDIYAQDNAISVVIPKNIDTNKITTTLNVDNIIAPLSANSTIGTLDFYYNNTIIASTNLKNSQTFEYINMEQIVNNTAHNKTDTKKSVNLLSPILLLIPLVILYIVLMLYKQSLRRKRANRKYRRINKNNASE